MIKQDILLILDAISKNLSIDILLKRGLDYSQIARMLSYCLQSGYLEKTKNGLELSGEGREILADKKREGVLIGPRLDVKIKEHNIWEAYIPEKSTIYKYFK